MRGKPLHQGASCGAGRQRAGARLDVKLLDRHRALLAHAPGAADGLQGRQPCMGATVGMAGLCTGAATSD